MKNYFTDEIQLQGATIHVGIVYHQANPTSYAFEKMNGKLVGSRQLAPVEPAWYEVIHAEVVENELQVDDLVNYLQNEAYNELVDNLERRC